MIKIIRVMNESFGDDVLLRIFDHDGTLVENILCTLRSSEFIEELFFRNAELERDNNHARVIESNLRIELKNKTEALEAYMDAWAGKVGLMHTNEVLRERLDTAESALVTSLYKCDTLTKQVAELEKQVRECTQAQT
jgi:phosphoglycolate phosphatase-like HAD superfamily hydrolase